MSTLSSGAVMKRLSWWTIPVEVHGDGRFVVSAREFVPAYLRAYEEGRLREKIGEAIEALRTCTLCPRNCRVNRLEGKFAVCKVARQAGVSAHFPHFGEEDVLRGWRGSGTIFMSWCNLRCVFCLRPDVRVLTDQGMQRIEDIFALGGDEVELDGGKVRSVRGLRIWTREGEPALISKAFVHPYRGEMVVIKPYGLPALVATPNHTIFAAREADGETHKVPAWELTTSHLLVVPKPRVVDTPAALDVYELLAPHVGMFRRSMRRRVPAAVLSELTAASASARPTSREIGAQLGYHPAYVRTLLGKVRRGLSDGDPNFIRNDIIEASGRIRFKTEKGPGVPSRVTLDPNLARLMGYYCAEGHIGAERRRPNSYRLIFSYGRHEPALVERTVVLIKQVFGVEPRVRLRRTTITVEVGSTSLALLFASLAGRKSHRKRVPAVLMTAPAEIVRAFLEAYVEGDGCRRPAYIAVNTVSEDLALGLVALLLRIGMFPYFYATSRSIHQTIEGRTVRQSEILYYVKWRRGAWEGSSEANGRLRYRETQEAFLVPIRQISRVPYDGPVYNLEVADEDHSYIASGVAVGNCQNFETSQIGEGEDVGPRDLARMMLALQARGCHNINFVTPEHVVPQILEALPHAIEGGLRLPIVYNTSAYDSLHSMRLMDGVADIYMPDFKLWDRERCRRYLLAPDYADSAREVIRAMHEQVGPLTVNEEGLAMRGLLVRHLVMPGMLEDTREILGYLAQLSRDTYVNVMGQYYPAWKAKTNPNYEEINRHIEPEEMEAACAHARAAGLWRLDRRWRRIAARRWC